MARKYKTKEEVLLRDSKTGEIRTYKEWIDLELPKENNDKNEAEVAINMKMLIDELVPIYD